jgi:hypothetical protein
MLPKSVHEKPSKCCNAHRRTHDPRSDEEFSRLLSLIMRLHNDIVSTFEADSQAFTPTFYERTVRGQTYTIVDEWRDGFLIRYVISYFPCVRFIVLPMSPVYTPTQDLPRRAGRGNIVCRTKPGTY